MTFDLFIFSYEKIRHYTYLSFLFKQTNFGFSRIYPTQFLSRMTITMSTKFSGIKQNKIPPILIILVNYIISLVCNITWWSFHKYNWELMTVFSRKITKGWMEACVWNYINPRIGQLNFIKKLNQSSLAKLCNNRLRWEGNPL